MALVDIFSPSVSAIAAGLEGKSILIYGNNKAGKTYVCAHMPKPLFFSFELGLEAIPDVPYIYPERWSVFESALDQFTRNPAKAKERYQTIVIDQLEAMYASCEKFVCDNAGVNSINQKPLLPSGKENGWWNGYVEVDRIISEVIRKIRFLLDYGFTFIFIAHEGTRKDDDGNEKIYPRGSKRIVDPVVDLVGYIGYAKNNGIDENGKVNLSTLYLHDTPTRLGGGRFMTIDPVLPQFTAEALTKAIESASESVAKEAGKTTVSNEEVVKTRTKASSMSYEEVKDKCIKLCKAIAEADPSKATEPKLIIEKHLGADRTISADTTPHQTDLLIVIYNELCGLTETIPSLAGVKIP